MNRNTKKGFTIVELIIVIAVIAVLAAVLIPTFSNLIKRANEATDTALVRNLNTALAADSATAHNTMTDALNATKASGYDVALINAKANGNEILWDSVNDVFCYRKDNVIEHIPDASLKVAKDSVKDYQYWVIASTPSDVYSTYLYAGNDSSVAQTFDNVKTGIDVGNENVTSVTYVGNGTSAQNVVIRTNGGTLNVNAANDTVHHYNYVKTLSVEAVSTSDCYHEHGFVGEVTKFASGKLVAASTAEFHQAKEEIQGILAGVTFEDLNATFGNVHRFDAEGVCLIDGCYATSPEHEHKWNDGEVVTNCTCGKDGVFEFTCTTCHGTKKETIPATGLHTWGTDNACIDCGATKTDESEDVSISVDSFLALKNTIENINDTAEKDVSFSLGANLATSKTTIIKQPRNTNITLDLNGCTLVLYNSKYDENEKCFVSGWIPEGRFEIIDSSAEKTGKIIASPNADNDGDGGLITIEKIGKTAAAGKTNAEVVLNSGVIDSTNNHNGCAIMMWNSGYVTINDGTVKARGYAISGTKYDTSMLDSKLIINGGNVISEESFAIYHPQCTKDGSKNTGEFTINGGYIYGKKGAVYIGGNAAGNKTSCNESGSKLTITGGTMASDGESIVYVNSTYLSSAGASQKFCRVTISISGGEFKCKTGGSYFVKAVSEKYVNGANEGGIAVYLKGGKFINVEQSRFVCKFLYTSTTAPTNPTYIIATKTNGYSATKYPIVNNADGSWSVTAK